MVLDYAKVCGACSTPLASPPRDGAGSMCAYLHTRQGRRQFERTLKKNRKRKEVIEAVASPPTPGNEATLDDITTPNEATGDDEATLDEDEATSEATEETKSQRYKRVHRDEINRAQQDRRNHT